MNAFKKAIQTAFTDALNNVLIHNAAADLEDSVAGMLEHLQDEYEELITETAKAIKNLAPRWDDKANAVIEEYLNTIVPSDIIEFTRTGNINTYDSLQNLINELVQSLNLSEEERKALSYDIDYSTDVKNHLVEAEGTDSFYKVRYREIMDEADAHVDNILTSIGEDVIENIRDTIIHEATSYAQTNQKTHE